MPRQPVVATTALYIKLGQSGEWENDCIREGQRGGNTPRQSGSAFLRSPSLDPMDYVSL
jgi:hypothetical protein